MRTIFTTEELSTLKELAEAAAKETGRWTDYHELRGQEVIQFAELQGFTQLGEEEWVIEVSPEKYVKLIKLAKANMPALVGIFNTLKGLLATLKVLAKGIEAQVMAIMAD